jgi:hypothetical protein
VNKEYLAPGILIVDNAFDNGEEIIENAYKHLNKFYEAKVGYSYEVDRSFRNCKLINFDHNQPGFYDFKDIVKLIYKLVDDYAIENQTPFLGMEPPSFMAYEQACGFFLEHYDDGKDWPRCISVVVYLNDVEVGGETVFTKFGVAVKPKAGRVLIFPSNFPYMHEALVPESDNKYVIVTWFRQDINFEKATFKFGDRWLKGSKELSN